MKRNEFIAELEMILDVDSDILRDSTELQDVEEWNSIGMLSVIALFDSKLNIAIDVQALRACNTIEDLLALTEGNLA